MHLMSQFFGKLEQSVYMHIHSTLTHDGFHGENKIKSCSEHKFKVFHIIGFHQYNLIFSPHSKKPVKPAT